MSRSEYYEKMKQLARETRERYGLTTPRVMRSDLRAIFRDQDVRVDICRGKLRKVRGAYFHDEFGASVLIADGLPDDPAVFTLAHELKHHLADQHLAVAYCSEGNQNEHIEIGAEVFAAEFIFPESDFTALLSDMGVGIGTCSPEAIVRLKHDTRTTLSYAGLAKRAMFLDLAPKGSLDRIKWKHLEESIYGEPLYKQLRRRRGSAGKSAR